MLKMAGWAVAMGNGSARVKEVHPGPSGGFWHGMALTSACAGGGGQVADVVVASNNEDGAAQAFDRFCSQPPRQAAN